MEKYVKVPRQRSPYSMKFDLAENIYKLKGKEKAAFYFPAEEWVLPAASTKEPEEREFVVDSGASMHMVSKKDLNSAEFWRHEDIEESDDGDDGPQHYNVVHKFILMPQAMKIPDVKAAVGKWEKLKKMPAWQLTKVRNKNVGDR